MVPAILDLDAPRSSHASMVSGAGRNGHGLKVTSQDVTPLRPRQGPRQDVTPLRPIGHCVIGHWSLDFLFSIVLLTEEDGLWTDSSAFRRRRGLRKKSSILWVIRSSSRSLSSRWGSSRLSSAAAALAQAS